MNRTQALAAAFTGGPPLVPAAVTGLALKVEHRPDAVRRGVPARVGAEVTQSLEAILPLFAAGFCAADMRQLNDTASITGSVETTATGFVLRIDGAAHNATLAYLLTRLIEAHSQTTAGAYQRLLDLLDGDEEEVRRVFKPLSLAADVSMIDLQCTGAGGQQPLDLTTPPAHPQREPLARAIPRDVARLIFDLSQGGALDEAIEHGFLTLNDLGCFHPFGAYPGNPELFVQDRHLIVDGWDGDPVFLSECLSVVTAGNLSGLTVRSEGET